MEGDKYIIGREGRKGCRKGGRGASERVKHTWNIRVDEQISQLYSLQAASSKGKSCLSNRN